MERIRSYVYILLLFILIQTRPALSAAFQIDEVLNENRTLEANQTEAIFGFPRNIDFRSAFILMNYEVNGLKHPAVKDGKKVSGGEGAGRPGLYWQSDRDLRFFRERMDEQNNVSVNAHFQSVIFKEGVKVQSGVSLLDANTIEKNIAIEPVRLDAAVALVYVTTDDWFADQSEAFTMMAVLPDENTLKLVRNDATEGDREVNAARTQVFWQVIEFQDGALVRSGVAQIPYYSTQGEVNLEERPITHPERTFLIFGSAAGAGAEGCEGVMQVRGAIENNRLISFKRAQKGIKSTQQVDIAWYLIELTDEAGGTQQGSEHFGKTDYLKRVSIQKIDPTRSMVIGSASGGLPLSEGKSARQLLHSNSFLYRIISPTELEISRKDDPEIEEEEADFNWSVVEFPPLSMGTPKGGEVYRVGNRAEITWQHAASLERGGSVSDGSHAVSLYLSVEEGSDGYPDRIASKLPAKNDFFSWLVPDQIDKKNLIGNRLRIKIVDNDLKERNSDVSKQNFAVKGDLRLIAPNGGDVWRVSDSDREILWNYKGNLGTVSIYYDLESGFNADSFPRENVFAKRVRAGVNGVGSYTIPSVPDMTIRTIKVKVVQDSDPMVYDISRNDFSILPSITVISPGIERDTWTATTNHLLKWKTKGTIQSFDLFYSSDLGKKWNPIMLGVSKGFDSEYSYLWQVPVESVANVVLIKVQKSGAADVAGVSSSVEEEALKVVPWIQMMKPKSDQVLPAGCPTSVVWRLYGEVDYLQVESSIDAGKNWVREAVIKADADDYQWKVPNVVTSQLMIRLIHANNFEHQAVSATLKTSGTIEVIYPNGGEVLKNTDSPIIRWKKSVGMEGVDIAYSTDGGLNYSKKNLLAENIKEEDWNWQSLPYIFNSMVKVRVSSHDDPSITDESDQTFTIEVAPK